MSSLASSGSPRRMNALVILLTLLCAIFSEVRAAKSAADYFVSELPGAPTPLLKQYAGHLEVLPETHGNMFFWLFKNRHIADRQRTVIWLNGGPGCSSMDGALMEIGPYRVNEDGTLRIQEGAWDEFANVLFVDQPVGTGFSYSDTNAYVHDLSDMADQMMKFLTKFFEIFPERSEDDLYIAGESFAGQWIPALASAILDHNVLQKQNSWKLKGLLIGNGWIDGRDQYLSMLPFGYESGLVTPGSSVEKIMLKQQETCLEQLDNGRDAKIDTPACEAIMQEMLRNTRNDEGCVNMYDVRLRDTYPQCGMNWPPDLAWMTPYLRRPDVLKALHIDSDKNTGWVECNPQVSAAFTAQDSQPTKHLLPLLLEQIPIVLFSGDKDMICNHIGTENIINTMEWNGGRGMEISKGVTAPKRDWTFEGEPAGQYQTARNLTYLRFYNSSHMVPFDYPRRTRDMIDRFMGVDIASIGGTPADSRIDGEKGVEVSVGGHPNSTAAQEEEKNRVQLATWTAYRRSGELALVIVIVAACAWGIFLWRERSRRRGYTGVGSSDPYGGRGRRAESMVSGMGLDIRNKRREAEDVEAARDFDETELDDLAPVHDSERRGADQFQLGEDD